MARTGVTKAEIRACRERLLAQGRHPSVEAVRQALGDTGSKSTIHRCLKELAREAEGTGAARADSARQLHALVERIADLLHADAPEALRERHAQALRRKDEELAVLRAQVATLSARVAQLEARPGPVRERAAPRGAGIGGFGAQLGNSRSGAHAASPFCMLRVGGRTELVELGDEWPFAVRRS